MQLGILGTGRMAVRLADIAARGGHDVILGSRTPERAEHIAAQLSGGSIRGGTYQAAAAADHVLPALFIRQGALDIVEDLQAALAHKVVIDVLNPFDDSGWDFSTDWNTSAAEELQALLPASRIVSMFKWPYWEAYENAEFAGGPMDVVYTGDDAAAKAIALDLFRAAPFRFLDGGPLIHARYTERMTLFAGLVGKPLGYLPRVGWKLLGEPWVAGDSDAYAHIINR